MNRQCPFVVCYREEYFQKNFLASFALYRHRESAERECAQLAYRLTVCPKYGACILADKARTFLALAALFGKMVRDCEENHRKP